MNSVAQRYAEAFFSLAQEEQLVDVLQEEMQTVKTVFVQNPSLVRIFGYTKISKEEKKELITEAFSKCHPHLYHFLLLLVDKGRIGAIVEIADVFRTLCNQYKGVTEGVVYSPYVISAEDLNKLQNAVSKNLGVTVELKQKKDESLISGVKVVVDGKVIDGSMKKQLETMRLSLLKESR